MTVVRKAHLLHILMIVVNGVSLEINGVVLLNPLLLKMNVVFIHVVRHVLLFTKMMMVNGVLKMMTGV